MADNKIIPLKGELVLGEWNNNFYRNFQYAKDNHIPILSYWSQQGCTYCYQFERSVLESEVFKQWAVETKIVMQYDKPIVVPSHDKDKSYGMDFTRNAQKFYFTDIVVPEYNNKFPTETNFPFVRLYWLKKDGDIVDNPLYGRLTANSTEYYSNSVEDFVQHLKNALTDWHGVVLQHSVTFFDYDLRQIGETQNVNDGDDADPPPDPTRDGYTFEGWKPDYNNVQSDLTCIAQYVSKSRPYENPRYVSEINRSTTLFKYTHST